MIRVQVYLSEEDDRWLEDRAGTLGTTKAALVREAIRGLRDQEVPPDQDPLLELIGMADYDPQGPTDVSERHDRYLTQWEFDRNRPANQ
jgi:hypothetical protein